eukprot:Gregarina_sp_Poly_1__4082@NODE_223_length_11242_cov_216_496107_g197_i0_p1_GENE_NODE_223_length_11242_cov_216_496107_g197_i0NODE_223_length_11242_cov_216_496107_g197_i0_p1_ORF_typecomplete_len687_score98_97Helicase_C/PF00271_31/6_6e15Helicase_C/PF00271_31/2_5e03_NODE_223_length_11242_cov_216_496107_g197_i066308690
MNSFDVVCQLPGSLKFVVKVDIPESVASLFKLSPGSSVSVDDSEHVSTLVYENWKRPLSDDAVFGNALIFCRSRAWTEKLAVLLTKTLPLLALYEFNQGALGILDLNNMLITPERKELAAKLAESVLPETPSPVLQAAVLLGVGFHHGGVSSSERRLVETAFCRGVLKVLASTSTLAMGVNLPISRVIFRSVECASPADFSRFHQMAGRAGRRGRKGEVVIMPDDKELKSGQTRLFATMERLITTTGRDVVSSLRDLSFVRLILETFVINTKWAAAELSQTLKECSLLGVQLEEKEFSTRFDRCTKFLIAIGCLYSSDSIAPNETSMQPAVAARRSLVSHRLFLISFFRLVDPSLETERETIFKAYKNQFHAEFNYSPSQLRVALRSRILGRQRNENSALLNALNQPIITVESVILTHESSNMYLSPLGRSMIESTLKLPEYIELMGSLLMAYHHGVQFKSLLHVICLCIPVSIFVSLGIAPDWNILINEVSKLSHNSVSFQTLMELLDIDLQILDRFRKKGVVPADPNSLYKEMLEGRVSVLMLCQTRLIWQYSRYYVGIILYHLIELQTPAAQICKWSLMTYTKLLQVKNTVGMTAACLGTALSILGLEHLSGLIKSVANSMREYSGIRMHHKSPTSLSRLESLRGKRSECLHLQGYTGVPHVAAASPDEIDQVQDVEHGSMVL